MRDKILNILGYLTQSVHRDKDLFYDAREIYDELTSRGYSEDDIEDAVNHIERMSLEVPGPYWSDSLPIHRIYSSDEIARLSPRIQGYLWTLKCRGILDHALEDEIIQKAMNLEDHPTLKDIKTVAALTVFGHETKFQVDRSREICTESRLH